MPESCMADVCIQLDDTVLQIFQVLEDLYAKQEKLGQVMKDGYLGISRARYLLGVKWVSADQILDADLSAKYRTAIDSSIALEVSNTNADRNSITAEEAGSINIFQLCEEMANVSVDNGDDTKEFSIDTDTNKQEGLRKRHTDNKESKSRETDEAVDKTKEQTASVSKKNDEVDDVKVNKRGGSSKALSLFGILTPQPLRSSQKSFEEAVKLAVELVDLKVKLSLLQGEYRRLSKKKESSLEK